MTEQILLPFSGRIIFDHLPKTGGTAVTTFLRDELGVANVSNPLIGEHKKLICNYGGDFAIISAHITFPTFYLDTRYKYITLLREPIDRTISWLFFVLNNHNRVQLPDLYDQVETFLESNGEIIGSDLYPHIANTYSAHFSGIYTIFDSDGDRLNHALENIKLYSVVGLYERMQRFIDDTSDFIGIPRPIELPCVNETVNRPRLNEIPLSLREKIIELNLLDIELYQRVSEWKMVLWEKEIEPPPARTLVPLYSKYDPLPHLRQFSKNDISVSAPILSTEYDITQGQLLTFEVPFSVTRPILELEMGIHIFDANKEWAFGTNSTLLKQVQHNVETGEYRVFHRIIADLPVGNYTAGFAFAERTEMGVNELYWADVACEFRVSRAQTKTSVGYVDLPATINLIRDGNT